MVKVLASHVSPALLFALSFGWAFLIGHQAHANPSSNEGTKISVFVSVAPQAFFVERVGGDRVRAFVMVGPGQSPATYEPRPKQMAELNNARFYFRVGAPFENVWIDRIAKANSHIKVIDTRQGIPLLPMTVHNHHEEEGMGHHGAGMKDPHIWLSVRLVKVQAYRVFEALAAEDPAHEHYYRDNLNAFHDDLDALDGKISRLFQHVKTRKFMVFHPAWGYFAKDYGLEQIPIEMEGKEPSAKTLAHVIRKAKEEHITVVFVQSQFSKKSAQTVSDAIGGKVVHIDPLARDYLNNMEKLAQAFVEVLQ